MSDVVTTETDGRIELVTINRPDQRSALNTPVIAALQRAWQRFAGGPERAAILTGAGNDAFSSGADLNDVPADLWRGVPGTGVATERPLCGKQRVPGAERGATEYSSCADTFLPPITRSEGMGNRPF